MSGQSLEKRSQLSTAEKGVYWTVAKRKKGYSTIDNELRLLLVVAFNNHPHVIMPPITKDTLQLKDANSEKVSVHKVLT